MIRDEIKAALVGAMKGGDKDATQTIRLIQSAIKNRDIELRTASQQPDDDQMITEVLQKMIKQRRESVDLYRKGNREELAAREEASAFSLPFMTCAVSPMWNVVSLPAFLTVRSLVAVSYF